MQVLSHPPKSPRQRQGVGIEQSPPRAGGNNAVKIPRLGGEQHYNKIPRLGGGIKGGGISAIFLLKSNKKKSRKIKKKFAY